MGTSQTLNGTVWYTITNWYTDWYGVLIILAVSPGTKMDVNRSGLYSLREELNCPEED